MNLTNNNLNYSNFITTLVTDYFGWGTKEYIWLFVASLSIALVSLNLGGGWLEFVSAMTGVVGAILIAKGKLSGYFHGVIATATYGWISYTYNLLGETIVYFALFLPMQFIGWWFWFKNSQSDNSNKTVTVVMKKLSIKGILLLTLFSISTIIGYALVIKFIGGYNPSLDSATSVLSIIATALMVLGYREQWYVWIITNMVAIVLWVQAVMHHEDQGYAILAMWVIYLLNSLYGVYTWTKGAKANDQ